MKTIVLGASGQLGQCLARVARDRNYTFLQFPAEKEADILDEISLETLFATQKLAFVINCAAYTAVDKAEDEPEMAVKINQLGAGLVASLCTKHGITLIHISTDFVFEGTIPKLLTETDEPVPVNVYGQTKLNGERAIAEVLDQHYIIRTSWLYSEFGNNFVKTMVRLGQERSELGIIADQIGSPTYGVDLAACILDIIGSEKRAYGLYHYSNEGIASWYDFACAIFELSGNPIEVKPLKTSDYLTRATHPAFSVMDKSKIKNTFGTGIPHWRKSLRHCLQEMGMTNRS